MPLRAGRLRVLWITALMVVRISIVYVGIALFTVSFSHLHYSVIQRGCEAISRLKLQNSPKLPHIPELDYIVMQMRNVNREKSYSRLTQMKLLWSLFILHSRTLCLV